jgi:hypothetical protein
MKEDLAEQQLWEDEFYEDGGSYASEPSHALRRVRLKNLLSWSVLISLGILVYEITAQPAAGAVIACARFGWEDLLTASWLRRTDPDLGRGRACFWCYLASALTKVAFAAVVPIFVIALIEGAARPGAQAAAQPGAQGIPMEWVATALEACVGLGLAALAATYALSLAWWHGVKLWLSPTVHRARRLQIWPPPLTGKETNWGGLLLADLAVLFLAVYFLPITFAVGLLVARNPPIWVEAVSIVVGLCGMCVGAIGLLAITTALERRLIATSTRDCWPPSDGKDCQR